MNTVRIALVIALVSCSMAYPAIAKQAGKAQGKTAATQSAGDKLANEFVDAVTRPVSDSSSQSAGPSSTPPGLAKKDKVPPGWSKGKKTGWNKESGKAHDDSLVDKAVKAAAGINK